MMIYKKNDTSKLTSGLLTRLRIFCSSLLSVMSISSVIANPSLSEVFNLSEV